MYLKRNSIVLTLVAGMICFAGCSSTPDPMATPEDQMIALEGGDLPLAAMDIGATFGEPKPEDALILQDIHFDFDQSEIREPDRVILGEINAWLLDHPGTSLMIEGHCDERGTLEYNLALGERRALSIRTYLTGLGTNPERLHTISYGEEQPLAIGNDEESWAQNRRGHFLVDYGEGAGEEIIIEEPID